MHRPPGAQCILPAVMTPKSSLSQRINIDSGTVWEQQVGYSRAVRIGPHIYVTGTIAADADGTVSGPDDAYAQTIGALRKIERALKSAGAVLNDIVRLRIYVTDLDRSSEVARAHREVMGDIRPATTMVEVSRLFADALVEIEADAVVADDE